MAARSESWWGCKERTNGCIEGFFCNFRACSVAAPTACGDCWDAPAGRCSCPLTAVFATSQINSFWFDSTRPSTSLHTDRTTFVIEGESTNNPQSVRQSRYAALLPAKHFQRTSTASRKYNILNQSRLAYSCFPLICKRTIRRVDPYPQVVYSIFLFFNLTSRVISISSQPVYALSILSTRKKSRSALSISPHQASRVLFHFQICWSNRAPLFTKYTAL